MNDLLENRFLIVSEDYMSWVDTEEEREFSNAEPEREVGVLSDALLESRRRERAKTLRMGRLEQRFLEYRQQTRTKTTRRVRKLADNVRETQELERRAQENLQRCQRRTRRLAERNSALELRLKTVVGSWGWRLEQRLRSIAARLVSSLRR
ncbi:MAG: hypothetical protein H0V21_00430 [Rubrobacter sp.]|nr:hypothetical protein [Rubrobacter sp.]